MIAPPRVPRPVKSFNLKYLTAEWLRKSGVEPKVADRRLTGFPQLFHRTDDVDVAGVAAEYPRTIHLDATARVGPR
jgi:hypothetical protein